MDWVSLTISALTGGLAATIFNHIVNSNRQKKDSINLQKKKISALKRELTFSLWLIDYIYKRIEDPGIHSKALSTLNTENVQEFLFGIGEATEIDSHLDDLLQDYFQQTIYLNGLITEYSINLSSNYNTETRNRLSTTKGEIRAICTPNATYRPNDDEPSLRKRIERILELL
jgi:hypothetical protein